MSELQVIVGLGITGLSCANYFKTQNKPFAVMDTRINPPLLPTLLKDFPNVEMILGRLDANLLHQASNIILSPGISLREPLIEAEIKSGTSVLGDIELFARAVKAPVIAITGTNAKSTVTTLVGLMAKAAGYQVGLGGNLGVPALNLLSQPQINLFVLELSSFQLETTFSLAPTVAALLNISRDHMDRYEHFSDYQKAKHQIFNNCEIAITNRDDKQTACTNPQVINKRCFTLQTPIQHEFGLIKRTNEVFLAYEDQCLLSTAELLIKGKHSHANALAALAIGHAYGFPMDTMLTVLRDFRGLPHRCQLVREHLGVKWFNDSKGTNVGASCAAIEGLGSESKGKLVLIAGGVGKNADFSLLVPGIKKYVRAVILLGEAAKEIAAAINEQTRVSFAKSLDEAVTQAAKAAKPGDSVLLSPACASFDMFKNFEHRGDTFMALVNQLVNTK